MGVGVLYYIAQCFAGDLGEMGYLLRRRLVWTAFRDLEIDLQHRITPQVADQAP